MLIFCFLSDPIKICKNELMQVPDLATLPKVAADSLVLNCAMNSKVRGHLTERGRLLKSKSTAVGSDRSPL